MATTSPGRPARSVDYISDDNPAAAQELKDDIEAKAFRLAEYPELYKSGRVAGTWEMVVRRQKCLRRCRAIAYNSWPFRRLSGEGMLIAHRGGNDHFQENSLAAFDYAIQCGCDGAELILVEVQGHRNGRANPATNHATRSHEVASITR